MTFRSCYFSFHSLDRTMVSSVIGVLCLILKLFCTASMPVTGKNKAKGKKVKRLVNMPRQVRRQSEAQDESQSQTSPTHLAPNEPESVKIPPEPPIDATVQDLRNAVQLLTSIVANQSQRQEVPVVGAGGANRAAGTKIRDFLNLDPPSFTGSDSNEDPQDFIDQIQRTLDVMHVSGTEAAELATYRLKGVAILWYETWKQSKGINAPPTTWEEFKEAFLDHYLPLEI